MASLPEKPYNELQRLGVMASGAAAGLVLGLLVVGLLEYRDSTFRREEEVQKVVSLPVLALIPVMSSGYERQAARRRGWTIDIAGTAVLLAAGVVLVFWRLHS